MVELATFPRCLSIHWTYEGHCESFIAFQCQVLEIEMPSQTDGPLTLPPVATEASVVRLFSIRRKIRVGKLGLLFIDE